MTQPSKSFISSLTKWVRKFFTKPVRELSRTGRITQTLWDAAQLQSQQRRYYQKIGEIALGKVRNGTLHDIQMERLMVKIDQIERILHRQESILQSFQRQSDVRDVLRDDDLPAGTTLGPA